MRFLFINPYYPLAENPSPPLGVGYLSAEMERAGIEVRVYDLVVTRHSKSKLERVMNDFQPDVVGATSVTMTFDSAIKAIVDAKRIDPRVKTAMGGPHVSFCAEKTMMQYPELDIVGQGEGERTIMEMMRALEAGTDLSAVTGMVWRNDDGQIISNAPRDGFLDVNTLPLPARHLTPLARYRAIRTPISMTSSRGCPFQCIFCVGRKMVGPKIRWRNAQSVVDEMEHLSTLGFVQINLADDLFTARKEHVHAVCDEILRRGLKARWTNFANVNTVDVPMLTKMREAGCLTVSFGLESGNAEILKTVKKGTRIEKILAAVDMCREAGVTPHGSFIVGLPGETNETLQDSFNLALELKQRGCDTGFHMLAPFPGTAVRDDAEKFKLKIFTDDWTQYHANHAITETEGISREMQEKVAETIDRAVEKMFFELADRIEKGTATEEDKSSYAHLERQAVYYDLMTHDVLETAGAWHTPTVAVSQETAIEGLVERTAARTRHRAPEIRRTIEHALGERILRYSSERHLCRWEWNDGPEAQAVSASWTAAPEQPREAIAVSA